MAGPTNVSLKGIIDWSQSPSLPAGTDPAGSQTINADTVDGKHYADIIADATAASGAASGDIAGNYPGPITVTSIQNILVSEVNPTEGQVLIYRQSTQQYEPGDPPGGSIVVPYNSETFGPGTHQLAIPLGVTEIRVTGCAAGGGAGGGTPGSAIAWGYYAHGGGGGGGQFVEDVTMPANAGGTLYISVGSGVSQSDSPSTRTGTEQGLSGASGQSTVLTGAASYTLSGGRGGDGAAYDTSSGGVTPGNGGTCPSATSPIKVGGTGGRGGGDEWPPGAVTPPSAGASSSKSSGGPAGYTEGSLAYSQGGCAGGAGGGGSYGIGAGGTATVISGFDLAPLAQNSAGYGGGGSGGTVYATYFFGGGVGARYWASGRPSGPGFVTIEWGY